MEIMFLLKSMWKSRKGFVFTVQGLLMMSLIVIGLILMSLYLAKTAKTGSGLADLIGGMFKKNVGSRG